MIATLSSCVDELSFNVVGSSGRRGDVGRGGCVVLQIQAWAGSLGLPVCACVG